MTSFRCLIILLALSVATLAARAEEPYSTELTPAWRTRLEALARPRTVVGPFTENRHTPLKKRPVAITGTVRIDRDRGLSLAYDQKRAPVVILDDKGLLLRHPDGREQPAPPSAEADLRLLHALFAFDLATLEKSFSLATRETPDGAWQLTFTRRAGATAGYRELVLAGDPTRLTGITLSKDSDQTIEIALGAPVIDVPFTADELARYFR